jgi:hypothetical protein
MDGLNRFGMKALRVRCSYLTIVPIRGVKKTKICCPPAEFRHPVLK